MLNEIQEEILNCNHNGWYGNYFKEEIFYWPKLIEWFQQLPRIKYKILDIGSAYGTLAIYLKRLFNADVYCLDLTKGFIPPQIIDKYNFNFELGNIELDTIPWNEKFDICILTEVIEHFNFHPLQTLIKIKQSLTQNRILYISTPNADEWGKVYKFYKSINELPKVLDIDITDRGHIWHYTKQELENILQQAGYFISKSCLTDNKRHINIEAKVQ